MIFLVTMGDLLHEDRPESVLDDVFVTIAYSKHIGLVVTRRSTRAAQYFGALDPHTARLWRSKLWIIFSAADQKEFDEHWANVRPLAERGWFVGVCCAPLIGEIALTRLAHRDSQRSNWIALAALVVAAISLMVALFKH